MGYVIVKYPEQRNVYIDGGQNGQTNKNIRVDDGTHNFDLGEPKDYAPEILELTVEKTDVLNPLEINFTKKS